MKIWLYGKVMSGKTTFASQFEGAYIISTDGNASYTFSKDKILRVRNYNELDEAIKKLKTIKPEWVIVDTTSYLIDFIRLHWLEENKVEHESELPYRGYTMLRSAIWKDVFNIANEFENVMFISHEQELISKNKFGREISYYQPVFEEKLKDQMSGLMSIIARTVKVTNESGIPSYELHIGASDDEFGDSRLPKKNSIIPLTKEAFDANFKTEKEFYDEKLKKEAEELSKRKSVIG